MKLNRFSIIWINLILIFFSSQYVFSQTKIPSTLRQNITADETTISLALELQAQGWSYIMPQPKSPQARWGNTDGRTTWYIGYWVNKNSNTTSITVPRKKVAEYVGDGNGGPAWRRGGTPSTPSKLEWLLSSSGGIKPID
jgi:hypothetical protein